MPQEDNKIATPEQLLCRIAKILENLKILYIITGGMAVAVWGRPRFTADIDIVVRLVPEKVKILSRILLDIDKDVYVSKQAIQDAIERHSEFNFIHPQTGLKVDFWVLDKEDRFNKQAIQNSVSKEMNGQEINFISPEDLIVSKLQWHKQSRTSKHLEDIKSILAISQPDIAYIKKWAQKHSTIRTLQVIINETSQ